MPNIVMPVREPMLMDRWPDENLLWIELRELEPDSLLPPAKPVATTRQFALMVSLVLAAWSVVEVATGGWNRLTRVRPTLRPRQAPESGGAPIARTGPSEIR